MSNDTQASFESEIKNWLVNVYLEQAPPPRPPPPDQSRAGPCSSSSSLRSLSMETPSELSPLFFNIPTTTPYNIEPPITTTIIEPSPLHQAIQTLSQIRNVQFPTIESEEAAMTKAFFAAISSSSPSASSSSPSHHRPPKASAFRRYRSSNLAPRVQRENLLKRSIAFLRSLRNSIRIQRRSVPTTNQLNHMISERRRREKLNESFQVLKSLLPPGTKRDKTSVLSATTEYLKSLKDQVEELNRLNQIMEARLPRKEASEGENRALANDQRVDVGITRLAESTSQGQVLDLHVNVRGECSMDDVVIRLLEFLKQTGNMKLMSVEATTEIVGTDSRIRIISRLKVEGDEWDESAFQEAVRRVVADYWGSLFN